MSTRRTFILGAGALPAVFPFLGAAAAAQSKPDYICPPCGCNGDKLSFDAPGKCPYCGMRLISRSDFEAMQHGSLPNRAVSVQFPFELLANQIFVPVLVNGKGPYTFILDTGAGATQVASEFAADMGVSVSNGSPIHFGLPHGVEFTTGPTLIPLASSAPLIARPVHGILGRDLMQGFTWRIAYDKRQITMYDADRFTYAGAGAVLPFSGLFGGYDPQIDAQLEINGRPPIPVRLTIDTGAGGTVISSPLVKEHQLIEAVGRTLPLYGVVGTTPDVTLAARLSGMRVGPITVDKPIVLLSQDTDGVFAGKSISVNLGGSILTHFSLIVDYARSRIILEPNAYFGKGFSWDASGIAFAARGADFRTFVILAVANDSPASKIGLRPGDVIAAIDGRPAKNYVAWQLQDLLKQSGHAYALTIKRAGKAFVRRIDLRSLL